MYLGTFKTDIEAARAYDRAAVFFHGPCARLNFPEEWPPERRAAVYNQHLAPPMPKEQGKPEDRGRRTEDREPKTKAGKAKPKKSRRLAS